MEIAPGVHMITVGAGRFAGLYPPNVYLLVGKRGAAFVDSGYRKVKDVRARLDYLKKVGSPRVKAVVVTHRHADHVGGAYRMAEATGAQILCHPVEKGPAEEAIRKLNKKAKDTRALRAVKDGERLDLGGLTLEFISTPGHTTGSLSVYAREPKVLFAGDMVLGLGTTVIDDKEGDLGAYLDSLRKMLKYPAKLLGPGHGPIVRDAKAKLEELLRHRLAREKQVLAALQAGKRTVQAMLPIIYPELDKRLHRMARTQLRSHLAKLVREGRAIQNRQTYKLRS